MGQRATIRRAGAFVAVLLVCSLSLFGQAGTGGTIVGTVTDPSGAAVPNATVTIANTDTNIVTKLNSNASGEFVALDVPIGHYNVRGEAQGFKVAEQKNIVLTVGQRARVDLTLEVGSTQETVTVEAVAVQSESSEVSDVITGQQVTQLATNGRSIYSLATLTPGASSNMSDLNVPTSAGGDATVSFNGMRQGHNLYMIDGGETADRGGGGGIDVMPSVDAIDEFRALTSNYSAEFGLSSSATMTMILKSGTKQFHASAWEFNRNDALDAANPINKANKVPTPELRFNTYGFNVGGPVFIPKVYNKNKGNTFSFTTSLVPYRGFNSVRLAENAENGHYNSLQAEVHSKIKNDLTLQAAYTFSRAMDPTNGTGSGFDLQNVSNPCNRAYDNGPSLLDRRHIALVNFIYDLPFFRTSANRFAKTALGGWEVSGIVTMETGLPLGINLGGLQDTNGIPNAHNRPDVIGSVSYPHTFGSWFGNTLNGSCKGALCTPALGAWGSLPRDVIYGPGRQNWNISVFKSFLIREERGSRFELRFESFNTFNHTQYRNVGTTFSGSDFGQITTVWDPRVLQLGAKLYF
jgi:hypothetical protein